MAEETMHSILTADGPAESWSRHPIWEYQAKDHGRHVHQRGSDIYLITDIARKLSIRIAFADLGLIGMHSIAVIDYRRKQAAIEKTHSRPTAKTALPSSSTCDSSLTYFDSSMTISLLKRGQRRRIIFAAPHLKLPSGETGIKADATLIHAEGDESLSTLVRRGDGKGFAYTTRYMPLKAEGTLFIGDRIEALSPGSLGAVTWLRGRGPVRTELVEAIASGSDDGIEWGLSLSGTNPLFNAVIVDGRLSRYGRCRIEGDGERILIEEESGRIKLEMTAEAATETKEDLRIFKGEILEVYGLMDGFIILDDGRRIDVHEACATVRRGKGQG